VVFYPAVPPVEVFTFTLFTSLAVSKVLRTETGIDTGIKWPNDIYVNNRKICGILTEFSAHHDRVSWVVVGVGVNVNSDLSLDPELGDIATSVRRETGKKIPRVTLLQKILQEIDLFYERFLRGETQAIREEWIVHSIVIGKPVVVTADDEQLSGVAESIDEHGALMIRTDQGAEKRIVYGDLSLRMKE
jgi:BirA family biotin operon repressor/biotin-[acetyl-CoA-carboxylase] ligase